MNGALDYDVNFVLSGGSLIAAGSAGMASAPSDGSTQASILMSFTQLQKAGTKIELKDSEGNVLAGLAPTKTYQTIVMSSPDLKPGSSYTLYADEAEVVTFEASSTTTWLDESGVTDARSAGPGGMGGGARGQGMGGARPMAR
jgi:hypothetical protein